MRILLVVFCFHFLMPQLFAQSEIDWSPQAILIWKDFQKKNAPNEHADAFSSVVFGFEINGDQQNGAIIKTSAVFDKKASWVRSNAQTDLLLKHEQLHFDICELYRRKFSKLVSEVGRFNFDTVIEELNEIFNHVFDEMEAEQDRYDSETDHSRVKAAQKVWNESIKERLLKSRDYQNKKAIKVLLD